MDRQKFGLTSNFPVLIQRFLWRDKLIWAISIFGTFFTYVKKLVSVSGVITVSIIREGDFRNR